MPGRLVVVFCYWLKCTRLFTFLCQLDITVSKFCLANSTAVHLSGRSDVYLVLFQYEKYFYKTPMYLNNGAVVKIIHVSQFAFWYKLLSATVMCQFLILSHFVKIGACPMCMLNYQSVVHL